MTIQIRGSNAHFNFTTDSIKYDTIVIGKVIDDEYIVEYLKKGQNEQYIIKKEGNKYFLSGTSIYLLNPPMDKYLIDKY